MFIVQNADERNAKLKASCLIFLSYGILLWYQERAVRPRYVPQTVVSFILSPFQLIRSQSPSGLRAAAKQQRIGKICQYNLPFLRSTLTFVQGKDFFDTDTNPAPRPAAPASPSFGLRWRNLFGSLHFSTRPAHAPQSVPLEPRRWNFRSFPVGISRRSVNVAPCRDEDVSARHYQ